MHAFGVFKDDKNNVIKNNKVNSVLKHLRRVIKEDWEFDGDLKSIELFARKGTWGTKILFDGYSDVTLWEIEEDFREDLQKNLPHAKVRIVDSIEAIKNETEKYDLMSVDDMLGCYGIDGNGHCDIVNSIPGALKDEAVLLLNVVARPYNYDNVDEEWKQRRKSFFGVDDDRSLSFTTVFNAYQSILNEHGFDIENYEYMPREYTNDLDYFYYLCLKVKKIN